MWKWDFNKLESFFDFYYIKHTTKWSETWKKLQFSGTIVRLIITNQYFKYFFFTLSESHSNTFHMKNISTNIDSRHFCLVNCSLFPRCRSVAHSMAHSAHVTKNNSIRGQITINKCQNTISPDFLQHSKVHKSLAGKIPLCCKL